MWRQFRSSASPPLINERMLAIDPALGNLSTLAPNVEWMNGLQFYLRRDLPIAHGHVIHIDSEWALTSVSQVQFWRSMSPDQFGDSDVRGVLSVDISNWEAPGSNGRSAMQCSREEVMREVWAQLKRSINIDRELLRDEDLHSWFLDPDIQPSGNGSGLLTNAEPLLVNLVNTWALRPDATTRIPNLFLASDYVRTYTDLATMEGANEAARRAVNGLLDATGFVGPRCGVWPLHQPEILVPLQQHDAARYAAGLPWDDRLTRIAVEAVERASPLLAQVTPLLERVAPYVSPVVAKIESRDLSTKELAAVSQPHMAGAAANARRILPSMQSVAAGDLAGPTDFLERLGWYREMLDGTLAASVPTLEPQRHLYALVKDFLEPSGQRLAAGAMHRNHARLGRPCRRCAFVGRRHRNAAQRLSRARRHRGRQRIATWCRHHASPCRGAHCGQHRRRHERVGHASFPPECGQLWTRRWRCASSTKSITCSSNVWKGRPSSWDGFGTMISRSSRKTICGSC